MHRGSALELDETSPVHKLPPRPENPGIGCGRSHHALASALELVRLSLSPAKFKTATEPSDRFKTLPGIRACALGRHLARAVPERYHPDHVSAQAMPTQVTPTTVGRSVYTGPS